MVGFVRGFILKARWKTLTVKEAKLYAIRAKIFVLKRFFFVLNF